MRTGPHRIRGITLVELVVTVAVMAIIAAIAAPNFADMARRNRLVAGANELVAVVQVARMEAIRTNGRVNICPTTDGQTCNGGDWRRVVAIGHKQGVDTPLRSAEISRGVVASADQAVRAADNTITFGGDGFARVGAAGRAATLTLCMPGLPRATNSMEVNVNVSRVEVRRMAGAEGCL